jgi:hypothetical protein
MPSPQIPASLGHAYRTPQAVAAFWLAMANVAIVCGRLVRRAWTCHRWHS